MQATVDVLNSKLMATGMALNTVTNPAGFAKMEQQVKNYSRTARNAANSTGMWEAHQVAVASATDTYTDSLRRQKVGLKDWRRQMDIANGAYVEQLRLRGMVATALPTKGAGGKQMFDLYIPTEFNRSLDTMGHRIAFAKEHLRSFSTQMVNWGKNTQWAGRQLMVGFTIPLVAFGAAAGAAAYQIDKELTRIAKVYDTQNQIIQGSAESVVAVEKELADLRIDSMNTAVHAAKNYGMAIRDTLEVEAELAATGKQGIELQESTTQVMRIAALGELENQDAIKTTIALQSIFRMSTEELTKAFNYMNAVENATSLQTKDFAQAIPIAAGPVKAFGGDIYELGVLMTAMKERGIEAAQGANALKATMQRLGRPSKQIRAEFAELTGGMDISKIVEESENLTEIFQKLGDITRDMDDASKRKIYAGLFGGWQVTRMSALVEGMADVREGIGQAGKAFQLAQGDATEWADAADYELERMQKSVSFRFKAAFETLKGELSTMGAPFLNMASILINAITKIIKAFNSLPSAAKWFLTFPVLLLAIAGPIIMLTGLLWNFAGNITKMGVAFTDMFVKMDLLDAKSAAAQKSADLASKGYQSQTRVIQGLTTSLDALNASLARSSELQVKAAGIQAPAGMQRGGATPLFLPGEYASSPYVPGQRVIGDMADDVQQVANKGKNAAAAFGKVAANVALSGLLLQQLSAHAQGGEQSMTSMLITLGFMAPLVVPIAKNMGTMAKWVFAAEGGMRSTVTQAGRLARMKAVLAAAINPWVLGAAAVAGTVLAIRDSMRQAVENQEAVNSSTDRWADYLGVVKKEYKGINQVQKEFKDSQTFRERAAEWMANDDNKRIITEYKNRASATDKMRFALDEYNKILRETDATPTQAREAIETIFYNATGNLIETNSLLARFDEEALESSRSANNFADRLGFVGSQARASAKEINNLGVAMDDAVSNRNAVYNNTDYGTWNWKFMAVQGKNVFDSIFRDAEGQAEEAGRKIGDRLRTALTGVNNPFKRAKLVQAFEDDLNEQWKKVLNGMEPQTVEALERHGVVGADALRQAMLEALYSGNDEAFGKMFKDEEGNPLSAELVRGLIDMNGLAGTLLAEEKGISSEIAYQAGVEGDIYSLTKARGAGVKELNKDTKTQLELQYAQTVAQGTIAQDLGGGVRIYRELNHAEKLRLLNISRLRAGLEVTNNLEDGFNYKVTTGNAKLDARAKKIERINNLIAALTTDKVAEELKGHMSDFQQQMADAELDRFDAEADAAMNAVERNAERRMDALSDRQEREQRRLNNEHEREQTRLDKMQERRRARIERAYDRRVDKIQDVIDAEQRAEDIRERIFEAEMTRLDRLNEAANRNIDFNVALNSGDLDEAAKIRNDMLATTGEWALEDAQERNEDSADARTERLEERQDQIEKARDAELEAIKKVEEREKKILERRQRRQEKMLDKRLETEKENLEDSLEATKNAEEAKWKSRRNYLERSLSDFTRYVAKDAADLKRHIRLWKDEHKGLSKATKERFQTTTDKVNDYLVERTRQSRRAITNDLEWETSGRKIARKMVKGAFGMNMAEFKRWMITGKYPNGGAKNGNRVSTGPHSSQAAQAQGESGWGGMHEGGVVGEAKNSRKGVARTQRGLHPTERMIRAQNGEFVVNRKASAKHRDVLEGINADKFTGLKGGDVPRGKAGTGGIGSGLSGMLGMAMIAAMKGAIRNAITTGGSNAMAASLNPFGSTAPGSFAGVGLSAEQIQNAVTIANVGRQLGASARDIRIALITAMQESTLRNLDYGDRDSVGLFQQRNAWGSFADRTNPAKSARMFFLGGAQGQRGLFDFPDRNSMSMTEAAQAVQVSAFPSAYAKWVGMANALFNAISTGATAGFTPGSGGKHRPVVGGRISNGIHGTGTGYPAIDIAAPTGTPIRAVSDGRIINSYDIPGYEPRAPHGGLGYRSYGRVIQQSVPGGSVLYAHLNERYARTGQYVKGGSRIGTVGNTGYSLGSHLHFGASGMSPYAWLKSGGRVKGDNTPAILHRNETVLTEPLSDQLHQGIGVLSRLDNAKMDIAGITSGHFALRDGFGNVGDSMRGLARATETIARNSQFANSGGNEYNLHMEFHGDTNNKEEVANYVIKKIRRLEERKPGTRRVNGG